MKKFITVLALLCLCSNLFGMESSTGSSSGDSQKITDLAIPLPSLQTYAAITYLKHYDKEVAQALNFSRPTALWDSRSSSCDPSLLPDNLQTYLHDIRKFCNWSHLSLLEHAVLSDSTDCFHYMAHHQKSGQTTFDESLAIAVSLDHFAIACELLQQSPPTPQFATSLLLAILFRRKRIFERQHPVEFREDQKWDTVAKFLVETCKADTNATFFPGIPALSLAAIHSRSTNLARLLLKNGANIDAKELGETPLYMAINYDMFPMVQLLLEYNPDTSIRSNIDSVAKPAGETAMELACRKLREQGRWCHDYDGSYYGNRCDRRALIRLLQKNRRQTLLAKLLTFLKITKK